MQSDWIGARNLGIDTASRPFCVYSTEFKKGGSHRLYLHYTAGPGCGA